MTSGAPDCAFVIGAPRSGTSWFQFMVGSHPAVATPQELDLFSRYLAPSWEAWQHELQRSVDQRVAGLITALTQAEFESDMRAFAVSVHRRVLALKEGAHLVLEKDPPYSLHVSLIERLMSGAKFIHLVRDGRDVAVSMMASSRSWNRPLPDAVRKAARMWRQYVEGARAAAAFEGRYLEIRYEDLLAQTSAELRRVFEFLGLESSPAMCERIVEANRFAELRKTNALSDAIVFGGEAARLFGRPPEPEGFFRAGRTGGWREAMSPRDLRTFDEVAGDLMREMGYSLEPAEPSRLDRLRESPRGRRLREQARLTLRRAGRRLEAWGSE